MQGKELVDLVGIKPTTSSMPAASLGEPYTEKLRARALAWLSYAREGTGGPGRDRTDDLFHARGEPGRAVHRKAARSRAGMAELCKGRNWWTWSGSNRRPLPCPRRAWASRTQKSCAL